MIKTKGQSFFFPPFCLGASVEVRLKFQVAER
jgi:hypothetical protein